ncbi:MULTISPECIES: 3-hydroxyacyl-CoA dehydrogenase NAD-binding domain-containing protein [unclassified Pseudomonas]|uniref:3-hydroxyacyl-CoA dehydrogenase NAD-binding domain-containing protein n=1 Tax=unclassified Pseudomonas TaxID=196821 RepID=UPI00087699A6|nr:MULTISPECIES: 3-hydroxyacyl-CoA dehydrogenase NAD-binding domain-containing protein [unclassified Pseudomonas]SCZ68399.1 short chain enoyl-CoA hydratase [Pseudomonas sp. NFPP17]SDA62950.1 short chain enoyl-CoA hydratase [Pseudomonas sp. NFPP15]SEL15848.1 short chain enoyl-CoA hydratase [Pseudomonas sp. NFPP18]SFA62332.1 short chain enoyl-CoA hydratase [Pseudomonas sp. NFPP13]SFT82065.1 short chain enoyl-CoA hydratase [Pseudomonas sp. NFPP25]
MSRDTAQPSVASALHGNILVLTLDNPPVNALGVEVRRGLLAAMDSAADDPTVAAILLVGAGRHFCGGADIREFGQAPQAPALPAVVKRIEDSAKPVVAAIQGVALGGGLEVALAAHYRLALGSARLGLPEVLLGLLPGAGGTQRLPRLIGARAALELMLSGRHLNAREALDLGVVDRLAEGEDALAAGLAYARELVDSHAGVRRTRDARALGDQHLQREQINAAREQLTHKAKGLLSPQNIIRAVEAALDRPFDQGLEEERRLFQECLDSPQRAGLVHAFFAEREVLKAPETRIAQPRPIEQVAVVGGGTMGAGIAVSALDAGLQVTMIERDQQALDRGRGNVEKVYDGLIEKGRLDAAGKAATLARFRASLDYQDLARADLVIEAVFEDMAAKQAVFKELDRVCKPGAVLASNTSYLDLNAIADSVSRPADVIGLHFFSPANIMKLLEIVVPAKVAPDVVATAFELAKKLRKVPVRAGVCDGFIGNRILAVYRQAADYMMEDGASPYQIDQALRDFGFPMGPFQVADLAGGDIGWATRKRKAATRNPDARYVQIADRLCERGWFGHKTGRGYYLYAQGPRNATQDPEVLAIIDAERARAGITPRPFGNPEILRRYMAAMINEGANVVHEGIALRPLDVDITFIHGYGFPRYRGGPLKYADQYGLPQVLADIREFAEQDPLFWKASPLLEQLVERGENFDSLNHSH